MREMAFICKLSLSWPLYGPKEQILRPYLSFGLDLTDFLTLQVGIDALKFNSLSLGLTTDITSPTNVAMRGFASWLTRIIN